MKPIFHYDPETGIFCGVGEADPSPLEENVWLVPAYATMVEPPKIPEGMMARWMGSDWAIENIPIPPTPAPEPEPKPIDPLVICKAQASVLLKDTDYSQLADVAPTLENKAEFDAYRATVRQFVISPVAEPVFPEKPKAVWKV